MRLWHYKLIESGVLPNAMLVSQWRECIAIKRQWEKGTLKHRLVSYVMEYDKGYFYHYVCEVINEMIQRQIKFNNELAREILEFSHSKDRNKYFIYPEHNNRYLKQCYYNLQEKADKGIITKEEWQKIEDKFGGVM